MGASCICETLCSFPPFWYIWLLSRDFLSFIAVWAYPHSLSGAGAGLKTAGSRGALAHIMPRKLPTEQIAHAHTIQPQLFQHKEM